MTLTAEQLQFMMDRGLTIADAVEFARLGKPTLSPGAIRTRKWREKQAEAVTESVTEQRHGDVSHVGARAQVVTPFSSSLRSEEVGVGGVERERAQIPSFDDWPAGKVQHHAKLIVEAVASPWLDPSKSPDLVTTAGRIVAWKRDGASWEHDVLPVVSGLCAKQRSRVASWKFFDQAIARSIADNRAALEIPEGRARATGPPANSMMDRMEADRAEARRRAING